MKKVFIAGIECVLYEQSLYNDNLVLMKYGGNQITTKQLRLSLDNVVELIGNILTVGSMVDSKVEKYKTALTVLKSLRMIFNKASNPNKPPSKTDVKTTMDVITEIALANESNEKVKNHIKAVNMFSQMMLGNN